MIRAVLFDLDGTLVETERLKALSYARAAVELRPKAVTEAQVVAAFKDVVGRSREEVATVLLDRFGLEEAARARMSEFKVSAPWEAFAQIRLGIYESMISDPKILLGQKYQHNIDLLKKVRKIGYKTGLATMSHRPQASRVMDILNVTNQFDLIVTRDDVSKGKPDPEVYLLLAQKLNITPAECLVIEDSPSGVKAALAAKMKCIAVATDFTRQGLHTENLLDKKFIVDDSIALDAVAQAILTNHR